jgi:hypothetical protein
LGGLPGEGIGDQPDAYPHDEPDNATRSRLTPRDAVDNESRAVRRLLEAFPGSEVIDPPALGAFRKPEP